MDIAGWLNGLGLGQYADAFEENDIDAETLPTLEADDLKELGVASLGHRKKLLAAIAALNPSASQPDIAAPPVPHAAPDLPGAPQGERRQVTVLFADITGYTHLSTQIDAEELSLIVSRIFAAVDEIIEGYGGTIDKHIGDEVMALFGAPIAHDDDPVRAVRAAADIHAAMAGIAAELERDLSLHIGIASGSVVAGGVGAESRNEYTVMGRSVNLAARLNAKARGGETIVSDAVRRAAAGVSGFQSLGGVEVKGFDGPVPAFKAVAQAADREPPGAGQFVGRRAEMRMLTGAMENCAESGSGQPILVRGEAGMGKSRLVAEFSQRARAAGFSVHKGLVFDFGVARGQDAMRTVVASLLGLPLGCSSEARSGAANRALAEGLVAPDDRPFLNDLLDLEQAPDERARFEAMNNQVRNARKFAFMADLMIRAGARSPILIVIEDIHWADGVMLRCMEEMARATARCPALLLMTSRIEGDPLDQAWRTATRESALLTIDLGPLRREESAEMAAGLLSSSRQFAEECIARAEGNPLFLDQLLRNSEERGDSEIPASIQSLVLSRMDRLANADRQALQAASIIGQRFGLDAVRALCDQPAYDCRALVEHTLVRPEGSDFLFVHALIQEGVYSSMLNATRQRLHRKAADYFAGSDPVLRAEHLDRAGDPAAAAAYLDAARAQGDLYHYEGALRLCERGLDLSTDPAERAKLLCYKGTKLRETGDPAGAGEAYRQALEIAPADADRVPAWIGLGELARLAGKTSEGLDNLALAQPAAEAAGLDEELAEIHHLRGNLVFPLGDYDRCRTEHETALAYAEKAGSVPLKARALGGLGDAYYSVGKILTAQSYLDECIKLARANGLGSIEVAYRIMLTDVHLFKCEIAEAHANSLLAQEMAGEVGNRRAEFFALWVGAAVAIYNRSLLDADRMHADLERMQAIVEQLGLSLIEPLLAIGSSLEDFLKGRPNDDQRLRQAFERAKSAGVTFGGPWILAVLTWLTDDPDTRRWAMQEGDRILGSEKCLSHNYLIFYQLALEVSLQNRNWDDVKRYCAALEDYTSDEPMPLSEFVIARARALMKAAEGNSDTETLGELRRLRDEAARTGFTNALALLDMALAEAGATVQGEC
ncbi:MAG TPA: adenylate/guanylate cyclase domain-containing protein [Devosiaceae bacterium]